MNVALPDNLIIETDFENTVRGVSDICLVVPSHAFRAVLTRLKSIAPDNVRIMWGTKGLDPANSGFLHQAVYEIWGVKQSPCPLRLDLFGKAEKSAAREEWDSKPKMPLFPSACLSEEHRFPG